MIRGSYVALVTPFKNGKIDFPAVEGLIEFHIENGTHGILLCGTTGEAPTFSENERNELIEFAIKKVDKRLPVMVGTGSNNIDVTIKNTNKAKDLGADSALVITPYYNKPTQEGMYRYFKEVAAKTEIDIVIYNVPGRTGVNISAETTTRLANEIESIVAIKEASGDLIQCSKIIRDCNEDFSLLSGEDALNYPILAIGGKGVVSVTANIVPELLSFQVGFVEEFDHFKAQQLHLELQELHDKMFIETNPIPVKTALVIMGKIEEEFRLPLCEIKESNRSIIADVVKKYKLI